jgi:hypothetical protein
MKTNNLVVILLASTGCAFLSGCGSKQAKDQAQAEQRDQRSAQEANQALTNVDHQMASGLYGQKPATPPPKPPDSSQSPSASTAPKQ